MSNGSVFVIFGATGNLMQLKLFPALYHLATRSGASPPVVLGVSRTGLDDQGFRRFARDSLAAAGLSEAEVSKWCDDWVHYMAVPEGDTYEAIPDRLEKIERLHDLSGDRILYLALPPAAFPEAISAIGAAGLHRAPGSIRLVVEKPFGSDLQTARALNDQIHQYFSEESVYRIDHYLGKETIQNLLVFRFANSIFESSWNRDRIESVEVTVAESIGIAGRAGYYETAGVVRDIVQNHLTQILALVAMEPPAGYTPAAIRNEKVKVIDSVRPIDPEAVVFGQFTPGVVEGAPVAGYREVAGVAANSTTATFVAMQLEIDNWRWQGVPFYVRVGKALPRRVTQVAVRFRDTPVSFFRSFREDPDVEPDLLFITLQPDEGFELKIQVKEPGEAANLRSIPLEFRYHEEFGVLPGAYETLLAEVVAGNQALFVRADMVESSWRLYDPVIATATAPHPYPAGSWGPAEADRLLAPGRRWSTR